MGYKSELQSNNTDLQSILDMILALGLVDAVTMITFTIAGTEYQAEEGMTWGEWVESEYNTGGYYIHNEHVFFSDGTLVSTSGYGYLSHTDSIIAGQTYIRYVSGSDD